MPSFGSNKHLHMPAESICRKPAHFFWDLKPTWHRSQMLLLPQLHLFAKVHSMTTLLPISESCHCFSYGCPPSASPCLKHHPSSSISEGMAFSPFNPPSFTRTNLPKQRHNLWFFCLKRSIYFSSDYKNKTCPFEICKWQNYKLIVYSPSVQR